MYVGTLGRELCKVGTHKYNKIFVPYEHHLLSVSLSTRVQEEVCKNCGMYKSVEKYQKK